jgi:hypothetical protein
MPQQHPLDATSEVKVSHLQPSCTKLHRVRLCTACQWCTCLNHCHFAAHIIWQWHMSGHVQYSRQVLFAADSAWSRHDHARNSTVLHTQPHAEWDAALPLSTAAAWQSTAKTAFGPPMMPAAAPQPADVPGCTPVWPLPEQMLSVLVGCQVELWAGSRRAVCDCRLAGPAAPFLAHSAELCTAATTATPIFSSKHSGLTHLTQSVWCAAHRACSSTCTVPVPLWHGACDRGPRLVVPYQHRPLARAPSTPLLTVAWPRARRDH